jgi:sterol desaturase/sphingolipid hydroxylase (fatty acid hydroxylase superfamily)
MDGTLLEVAVTVGIGLVCWYLAAVIPFRKFASPARLVWDVAAAVCTSLFGVLAAVVLDRASNWELPFERWYELVEAAPWWIVIPAYILLADLGAYWAHRALHMRWLWPTHAWHHSSQNLYWLSGLRASPVHILILTFPYYVAYMVFPLPESAAVAVAALVVNTIVQHLIHSNIRVPCARALERLLITPRFHFVHHDVDPAKGNTNFGLMFSLWDRWFGTYTDPDTLAADRPLGLGHEVSYWRLLLGLPAARARNPDPGRAEPAARVD